MNTRISTDDELVGADNASIIIMCTRLFMGYQGYNIDRNILY